MPAVIRNHMGGEITFVLTRKRKKVTGQGSLLDRINSKTLSSSTALLNVESINPSVFGRFLCFEVVLEVKNKSNVVPKLA